MAALIPVVEKPEPQDFDRRVRVPGKKWLKNKGISTGRQLSPGAEVHPYWRECLGELHSAYEGICAYLSIYVERVAGGISTDHFVAKSKRAGLAYEWSNYRLACLAMNTRKRAFDDVLDPFKIPEGTFHLELVSGRIYPNSAQPQALVSKADMTIERLGLDDQGCRQMRVGWYDEYREGALSQKYLRTHSPFVWFEARRQGLL